MKNPISRRDVILHGSSALGVLFLAGCASRSGTASGDMPGPIWPGGNVKPPLTPPKTTPYPTVTGPTVPPQSVYPSLISRTAWTSAGIARPREVYALGKVNRITIHHDGMNTFTSTNQNDAAKRLESIRVAHVGRGWADIGYHYIIDPAGRVWEGRSVSYQGAHVQDQNENNLGIMCMGNFMQQRPSAATLSTLNRFVASQMRLYKVPLSRVYTHQEIGQSACPGTYMQREMTSMRARGGSLTLALADLGSDDLAYA